MLKGNIKIHINYVCMTHSRARSNFIKYISHRKPIKYSRSTSTFFDVILRWETFTELLPSCQSAVAIDHYMRVQRSVGANTRYTDESPLWLEWLAKYEVKLVSNAKGVKSRHAWKSRYTWCSGKLLECQIILWIRSSSEKLTLAISSLDDQNTIW